MPIGNGANTGIPQFLVESRWTSWDLKKKGNNDLRCSGIYSVLSDPGELAFVLSLYPLYEVVVQLGIRILHDAYYRTTHTFDRLVYMQMGSCK